VEIVDLYRNDTPESRRFWEEIEELAAKAPEEVKKRIEEALKAQ